ncbi:hypothetical protein [Pontibacterium sinense]|nr:hypothetical protein [Pontibacterium sinense]
MKKNEFPGWAPKSVISEWEEKLKEIDYWNRKFPMLEHETDEADLLYRILTYSEMKKVWERLPKYDIKPALFSSMIRCSDSFLDMKPYNLTPKDYREWIKEVRSTALKLRELIKHSEYDRIFQERYITKRQKCMIGSAIEHSMKVLSPDVDIEEHKKVKPPYELWPDLMPTLLTDALLEIANLDSDTNIGFAGMKARNTVKLDKPNHPNAKRSFFIKSLTQMMREHTGKPLREIVTITTATVFDNPSITERQIIRTAP